MKWILGSSRRDLWVILPGVFAVCLVAGVPLVTSSALLLFLTFAIVDSGHIYTTILRTHIQNPDRKNFWFLNAISLAIFTAITIWCLAGGVGIWKFITYATLFHHIRQHYGISRWYHGLNQAITSRFHYPVLYSLWILSMAGYHFRPMGGTTNEVLYSKNDFWLNPDPQIYGFIVVAYLVLFIFWAASSLMAIHRSESRAPGAIYEMSSLITYAWAGFFAPNFLLAAIPMFFSHGIPYMALIATSLPRTRPHLYKTVKFAAFSTLAIAVLFGMSDWKLEEIFVEPFTEQAIGTMNFTPALLIGLYLTPLLSHYIIDGIIWRRKYSESTAVYKTDKAHENEKVA